MDNLVFCVFCVSYISVPNRLICVSYLTKIWIISIIKAYSLIQDLQTLKPICNVVHTGLSSMYFKTI